MVPNELDDAVDVGGSVISDKTSVRYLSRMLVPEKEACARSTCLCLIRSVFLAEVSDQQHLQPSIYKNLKADL